MNEETLEEPRSSESDTALGISSWTVPLVRLACRLPRVAEFDTTWELVRIYITPSPVSSHGEIPLLSLRCRVICRLLQILIDVFVSNGSRTS